MKWDPSDSNDYRVKRSGRWIPIVLIPFLFPKRAGVYVFADAGKNVKYVGKAGAGRLRDEAWNAVSQRNKAYRATLARYFVTNSDAAAISLEKNWIAKYQPLNNLRGK